MKKILVNLLVFAVILSVATSTYAFSISVDANVNEVKTNNEITLEVNFEQNVVTTDFVVNYDASKFDFVKANTKGTEVNDIKSSGELIVCFYDMNKIGTDKIELVFKSKEDEGVGKFELLDITGHTKTEEVSKVGSTSIKNVSINNEKDNVSDKETITSTNGSREDIDTTVSSSRLPDTGAAVSIVFGVILLLVALILFMVSKNKKSKEIFSIVIIAGIVFITNNTLAQNLLNIKVDENKKVVTVESFVGSIVDKEYLEDALNEEISTNKIATGLNIKEDYSLVIYGDINKDGKINSSDIYQIIYSDINELDDLQKIAANVYENNNNEINENDVKLIEKYILRLDNLLVTKLGENEDENIPSTGNDGEIEKEPDTEVENPGTEPDTEIENPGTEPDTEIENPGTEPDTEIENPGTEPDTDEKEEVEERQPICRDIVDEIIYSNKNLTWDTVTVYVTGKEELGETEGWTLSEDKMTAYKEYTMNTVEKVKIYAANGDYEEIKVIVLNIWDLGQEDDIEDLTAEITARNKDGKYGNTYSSVIVTITTNNTIKCPKGWTQVGPEGTKFEKEYKQNTEEKITLTDEYGSKLIINIKVDNILIAVENLTLSTNYSTDENGIYLIDINDENLINELGFIVNSQIDPVNASNKKLEWSITNENGRSIDYARISDGRVIFDSKTIIETMGDVHFAKEVLADNVKIGSVFVVTAKTTDISEIERSITCRLEASPTRVDIQADNIYLFINGNKSNKVGTTTRDIYDENGNFIKTVEEDVYQAPSLEMQAKVYPETATINKEVKYRIVKKSENNTYNEVYADYAMIEGNVITAGRNTGAEELFVEAYTGNNGKVVDRARLHIYTTPESITLTNSNNEEVTSLSLNTNKSNSAEINVNLLPETVSTEFDSSLIRWEIDNASIIEIPENANGNKITVKAKSKGTANLTVRASNGKSVKIPITVGVALEGISIVPSEVTLEKSDTVKESKTLTVQFKPEDYTGDRTITWSSSNTAQVTVDKNGNVTAVENTGKGSPVTITATLAGNTDVKATAKVYVSNIPSTLNLSISEDTLYLNSDKKTAQITAEIDANATKTSSQVIYWETADESIAKVKSATTTIAEGATKGTVVVEGVRNGTTTIKAYTAGTEKSRKVQEIEVNVGTDPTGITTTFENIKLVKGTTKQISVNYTPLSTTHNIGTSFTTDNTDIATVTPDGEITAVAAGTAKITVTTDNSKTDVITVNVIDAKEDNQLEFRAKNFTVKAGTTINTMLLKGSKVEGTASYTSSNEEVAKVDSEGKISTLKAGSATITVKVGDKSASTSLTVLDYSKTATVVGSANRTLKLNNNEENKATLEVTTNNSAKVTWYTSDSRVATVSQNGEVVAKAGGTCKIYAVPPANNPTIATFNITVKVAPSSIDVKSEDTTNQIISGGSKKLKVTYNPTDANTDKGITWEYNTGIIESIVDAGNDVYTVKALSTITSDTEVTIKAKTANGKTKEIELVVKPAGQAASEAAALFLSERFATADFVTSMLETKVRANAEKEINYIEIANSEIFDITTNNNYYAIINENSETKLVKIVNGQKLENAISINSNNILDIEAVEENIVNIVIRSEEYFEIIKVDFESVEIIENYKLYTEKEENVEKVLVSLNEKENKFTVLKVYVEGNVKIERYSLNEVKDEILKGKEINTLSIDKGLNESNFNKFEVKAFTVLNDSIYFIEENEKAYLTIFRTSGNIEVINRELERTNIKTVKATAESIFVGI